MKKTLPLFFLLLLFIAKPALAETSVNVSNSGSGNCNSHIKITENGVTKEVNSSDCSDISLSMDNSGNVTQSSSPQPTASSTSTPTYRPTTSPEVTASPTPQPTDSASPSAEPSSTPTPTTENKSGFDQLLDQIGKLIGNVFGVFDKK